MKMRIRKNSLRLRLQRGEVQKFGEIGKIEETIQFDASQSLTYTLERVEGIDSMRALMDGSSIRVEVPSELARSWTGSEEIGMTGEQSLPNGERLHLLIEKDLQCLKPRTSGQWEDDSDAYSNPNPTCGHSP